MSEQNKDQKDQTNVGLTYIIKMNKDQAAIADGPIYQQLVNVMQEDYAKEKDPTTGLSLETQAMDSLKYSNHYSAFKDLQKKKESKEPDATGIVYVVDPKETSLKDVVDVSEVFEELNNAEVNSSALVFSEPETDTPANQEIIRIATEMHVPIYRSFTEYIKGVTQ